MQKQQIKQSLELKRACDKKIWDKSYVKCKSYDNSFNSYIEKNNNNILYKTSQYFPKTYDDSDGNMKIELDL